jgi:branched-chain amino acid transport system permease protein
MGGVYAEMGINIVVECFVVVVVGGMGSLLGAVLAGLLIGEVMSFTTLFAPKFSHLSVFIVMAIVLILRPSGLFGESGMME